MIFLDAARDSTRSNEFPVKLDRFIFELNRTEHIYSYICHM